MEEWQHSRLGIAAFASGLVSVLLGCGGLASILLDSSHMGAGTWGFFVFAATAIAAFGLGLAGVAQRRRRRLFGILGLVCFVISLWLFAFSFLVAMPKIVAD